MSAPRSRIPMRLSTTFALTICIGGEIGRCVGPGQIQTSDAKGEVSLQLDHAAMPQPTGFVAALPGETWRFQLWHRDAVGGDSTMNATEALEITFE